MLHRLCNIPINHNILLLGPRQVGKTTLLDLFTKNIKAWKVDLLNRETFLRYLKNPAQFYKEASQAIKDRNIEYIYIDEIQKIPEILDDVQRLIQEFSVKFLLTGSSARKLRRFGSNLLGGRLIVKKLAPLTYLEIADSFNLNNSIRYGTLPHVYLEQSLAIKNELLLSYVTTYLTEEIQQESLVRNLPGFVNFLEVAAQCSGELLNYSKVARDCTLEPRTVQSYYGILTDTLLGTELQSFAKSVRRRLRKTAKYYLFDIGVINAIERQLRAEPDKNRFGRLFEHLIILDTQRIVNYLSTDGRLFFWRTKDDQEVDLLIENRGSLIAAIEIKSAKTITKEYLSSLKAFTEEHPSVPTYVVAQVEESFMINSTKVLPWQKYFEMLPKLLE